MSSMATIEAAVMFSSLAKEYNSGKERLNTFSFHTSFQSKTFKPYNLIYLLVY
jgi:hypothetical protein